MFVSIEVTQKEIEDIMYFKNKAVLTYTIQYPYFLSLMFQRSLSVINAQYEDEAKEFQQYCQTQLYPSAVSDYEHSILLDYPIHQYEGILTYTLTYNQNCALSLFFDRYEYAGGAHGSTLRSSNTWDLNHERQYQLEDFFPYTMDYRSYVIKIIKKQIVDQNQFYYNNIDQLLHETFDPNQFYLTDNGVVIYFQQYAIAPYSSGIVEFLIPFAPGTAEPPSCRFRA